MSGISGQCAACRRLVSTVRDYSELTKIRVTALIVMTAWCGYFVGASRSGVSALNWSLLHALFGIALVSGGTAALNEVMERETDRRMRRTAMRPLPSGRMGLLHASLVGSILTLGGSLYLATFCNWLTGELAYLTALVYLVA